MNKFLTLATCTLVLSLSACGSDPKIVEANSEGISFRFDGSDEELKDVTVQANAQCANTGKMGVLTNVSETEDSHVAHFECREHQPQPQIPAQPIIVK